jgi:hypothetical protein
MRKLKINKDKTLTKYGYVEIEDITLPIRYCGLKRASISASKLADMYKIPNKTRSATEEEKKQLEQAGYDVGKITPFIKEFDTTSKEYIKLEEEKNENILFLDMAIHIDLKYVVEDNKGKEAPLWQTLGLTSEDDVIGMSKWLANRDLSATRYKILMQQINAVEVLGYSSYDLIPDKEEVIEDVKAEREPISE